MSSSQGPADPSVISVVQLVFKTLWLCLGLFVFLMILSGIQIGMKSRKHARSIGQTQRQMYIRGTTAK